jgi:sarcosine oxidase
VTHVIVIGGGAMGSSAAWQLARRGADVTLLEQFEPRHDHGASHGSSRIFRLSYPDQTHVRLAQRALIQWRELEEDSGREVLTLTGGVDHGPEQHIRDLYDALRSAGASVELLHPAAAAERWPGLRFDDHVVHHPDGGRVHADDAVVALQEAAAKHGADVRHGVRVADILETAGGVVVTTTEGEVLQGDGAVVAAGGWTPLLRGRLDGLLRTTQEQPAHFAVRDPAVPWPSFLHHPGGALPEGGITSAGLYGLGSVDGIKVGFHGQGPVVDPDHRDRKADPDVLRQLSEYVERWLPGVDPSSGAPISCLYTMTPDQCFIVDRRAQITVLAGFSGHGFKFASVIGELAAGLALEGASAGPEFAVSRFVVT